MERGSKTNKWTSTSKKKDSSYKSQSFRVKQNKKMDTEFKNRIFIELNNITSMASHRHNRSIPGSWRRPSNIEEIDDEEEHTGVATLSMDEEHNEQSNFHNRNSAYDQERKVETHTSKTEPSSFTKQLPVENTIHPYIQGSLDIDLQTIKAYRMSIQQMITMSKHISSRFLQSSSEDDETIDKISSINTSINEASHKISLVREEIRASIESRRSMLMGLHSLSHRYTTHYDIIDESRCIEVTGRTLSYNRTQYSYDRMCIDPYDIVHTYMYMMYDSIHSTIVCTGVDTYSLIHSIMLAYVGMIAHYSMYHTHVYIIYVNSIYVYRIKYL